MSDLQISRPERWSIPFSDGMTDDDVQRLMSLPLFSQMDQAKFSSKIPLHGILKNDARVLNCTQGEIIVREGDWGNSAFFLLSGAVRVEIERGRDPMPLEMLGRTSVKKKTFFESLKQLWAGSKQTEARDLAAYSSSAKKGDGAETRVFLQDFPQVLNRYKTTTIEAVEFFGEQSALGRIERTATVFADGDCELLEIRWQGIRDLMHRVSWLKKRVNDRFRAYGLRSFLRTSPYFEHLVADDQASSEDAQRIEKLSDLVLKKSEFKSYGSYDTVDRFRKLVEAGNASDLAHESMIAKEGDYPYGVILVRSGIVRVSQKYNSGHKTVSYLTPGQAFAVDEITEGWRDGKPVHLTCSARAVGYATVVVIPTAVFEKVVLEQLLQQGVQNVAQSALLNSQQKPKSDRDRGKISPSQMDPGLLEFLVERRLVNGTATMLIDLDRCTRCDDCVRACATAHDNNPRFLRHGPTHGRYMVANACMHCADPVCMIQCPTGAIHRSILGGEVLINDATCVGCTACANNCPYDAIRMVQVRDASGMMVYPTSVATKDSSGANHQSALSPTMKEWEPITKATKCDLCVDQLTGPACQNACPHDALVRLNLGDFETTLDWLNS
ncbi:MAG: cyclic nucleotide-binding domain-containing protein [Fuerstiella sp.]